MCYGEVFRKMRIEKKMTIVTVAKGILSIAQLSKFERGESNLSITKFGQLLERINITVEEFEFLSSNYKNSSLKQLVIDIKQAYTNRDPEKMIALADEEFKKWELSGNKNSQYNYIMISIMNDELNDLKKTQTCEVELLIDYLFSIEDWTYYEIVLFGNSISAMPIQTIIVLSEELFYKTKTFHTNDKHLKLVLRILLNASLICLLSDENAKSLHFQTYISELINSETYLYEKNLLMFSHGLYLLKTNHISEGIKKVETALEICRVLNSHKLVESYSTYYHEIMATL
ncbi:helix-turn-helix domain-containing protein [uncultured Vagococcus sp.]|uniref:Rgg/GadR/MutR family transcriptional regulator n=1 Tax=uncultured Vagococcus sp. TaxID=189676 RepID=UPI0028D3FDD8|nr:helix-turn-helix domain-containing protein [uncultured Vagococcus sp.]